MIYIINSNVVTIFSCYTHCIQWWIQVWTGEQFPSDIKMLPFPGKFGILSLNRVKSANLSLSCKIPSRSKMYEFNIAFIYANIVSNTVLNYIATEWLAAFFPQHIVLLKMGILWNVLCFPCALSYCQRKKFWQRPVWGINSSRETAQMRKHNV